MQVVRSITPAVSFDERMSVPLMEEHSIKVHLDAIRFGARDINIYEFVRLDGSPFPPVSAGSHIDLNLPSGMVRQYSLIEAAADARRLMIGVKLDANSRGGSSYIHNSLRVGSTLTISSPRNNFPLQESASHSVLFAGGIGITPIWCMWRRLKSLGRPVRLYYASRSKEDVVFLDQIVGDPDAVLHLDDENAGTVIDLRAIIDASPKDAHLYCCGPTPMLKAFEIASAAWPADQVHVEYFTAQESAATEGGYTVVLSRSQKELKVAPGQTILAALLAAGIDAPYSCEEGLCGACMTAVLEGTPDHRDTVLTPAERETNKKIMICCSGSKGDRLVLDL